MGIHHGKEGEVKVGANIVGKMTKWSLEKKAATADGSAAGEDWDTHKVGRLSGSGSISVRSLDGDAGQAALAAGASVQLELRESLEVGSRYLTCTATITSDGIDVSHDDIVSREYSFQANGEIAEATVTA